MRPDVARRPAMRAWNGPDRLLLRITSEYLEMPGLQLTAAQAARLLGIAPGDCVALLEELVAAGFLRRGARGHYVRAEQH